VPVGNNKLLSYARETMWRLHYIVFDYVELYSKNGKIAFLSHHLMKANPCRYGRCHYMVNEPMRHLGVT